MAPRPIIFISAASKELKSARQLVANTLTFLGYEPEWQDVFGTEEGDLQAMLRRRIDASAGVVQLIGQCYGSEPLEPDAEFGRVSFTQYEALYARRAGKKVWPLILDEEYVTDPHDAEPAELRELQQAYRQLVRRDIHVHHPIDDRAALELQVHKIRNELAQLRRGARRWAMVIVALLLLLGAAAAWTIRNQHRQHEAIAKQGERVDAVLEHQRKVEQALILLAEAETREASADQKLTPEETRARAYAALEKELGLAPGILAKELPALALVLFKNPETSSLMRARASYALNKFADAEQLSLASASAQQAAFEKAQEIADERRHQAVESFLLAASSAHKQTELARAVEHARAAAGLTNRDRDAVEWAHVQWFLGYYLQLVSQYRDAVQAFQGALAVHDQKLGSDHPLSLSSRHFLGVNLYFCGLYAEAEQEFRKVLAQYERSLGSSDASTVLARHLLVKSLRGQGKTAEASIESQVLLKMPARKAGESAPEDLWTRFRLAEALRAEGKLAEAEEEHRAVLALREMELGPEHSDTLWSRNHLGLVLTTEGKYAEAERELRVVLAARERILGPKHADTLSCTHNLALALRKQDKLAEALQFAQRARDGRREVLGSSHPDYEKSARFCEKIEEALRAVRN